MTSAESRPLFNRRDVRRRFDNAAASFDQFDFAHAVTRDGLLARLEPMRVDADIVIDLACATGSGCAALAKRFRGAHIVAVDLAMGMLQQARRKRSWRNRFSTLQASADALPFADQAVDVIFANQLLPWIDRPDAVFAEANRVLRENGLFIFASLGPDSLAGLRQAWQQADAGPHVAAFPDMHNLGDAAVRAGLRDPVLDVDHLTISYRDADSLFRDLTGCGARNCIADRALSLTGKNRFLAMKEALDLELDLELVYGHCWGSGPRSPAGEFRIDPAGIGRR